MNNKAKTPKGNPIFTRKMLVASLATIAVVMTVPVAVVAQDDAPPVLIVSHCMKSTSADYVGVETEIWLPMHQENVNNGKMNSWALYWIEFGDRSKCDYFVVESYLGPEQFNAAGQSSASVFETVHPGKSPPDFGDPGSIPRRIVANHSMLLIAATEPPPTE